MGRRSPSPQPGSKVLVYDSARALLASDVRQLKGEQLAPDADAKAPSAEAAPKAAAAKAATPTPEAAVSGSEKTRSHKEKAFYKISISGCLMKGMDGCRTHPLDSLFINHRALILRIVCSTPGASTLDWE